MKILFFGSLADKTGTRSIEIHRPADLNSLRHDLEKEYPGLSLQNVSISVNHEVVHGNTQLADGDEIAFMPPYAGG